MTGPVRAWRAALLALAMASAPFALSQDAPDNEPEQGPTACEKSCTDQCKDKADQCKKDIDMTQALCRVTNNQAYCKAAKDKGCKAAKDYCEAMCFVDFGGPPKCEPPPPPPPPSKPEGGGSKGGLFGEPHLMTFDGQYYDVQSTGDFLLFETLDGEVSVHIRFEPFSSRTSTSAAVGIRIGDLLFQYDNRDHEYVIRQGDRSIPIDRMMGQPLDGVMVEPQRENGLKIVKPGVVALLIDRPGRGRVDVFAQLLGDQPTRGLWGDNNGSAEDDVIVPENVDLRQWLNGEHADAWRVTDETSLLPYREGETVADFIIRPHPVDDRMPSQSELEAALDICEAAKAPASMMGICVFDVAMTGDASLAVDMVDLDTTGISFTLNGVEMPSATFQKRIERGNLRKTDPASGNGASDPSAEDPSAAEPSAEDPPTTEVETSIWADFDTDWSTGNWAARFDADCPENPTRSAQGCRCLHDALTEPGRPDPEDRRARIAYLLTQDEITSNSAAMDALRDWVRNSQGEVGAAEENRLIIDEYRLFLTVSRACQ